MKQLTLNLRNLLVLFIAIVAFGACQKDQDLQLLPNNELKSTSSQCGEAVIANLNVNPSLTIGDVSITNTSTHVNIEITTTGSWQLENLSVYVGSLANVPMNGPNDPNVAQFPHQIHFNPTTNHYVLSVPTNNLGSCFIVALHADAVVLSSTGEVIQSETAWADGELFDSEGTATYAPYCLQACEPCEYNVESFNLYGGQTILVGSLSVTNDATNLYVSYNTTGNWFLSQTHLYVGTLAGMPTAGNNAPIPGHFPYSGNHSAGTQTVTYTIPLASLPPCYIIVAHAAVVKVVNGRSVQGETAFSFGTPFPNTKRWGWYSSYCTQTCQ